MIGSFFVSFFVLLSCYCIYDFIYFKLKSKGLPGPSFTIPFFGCMFEIIRNPFDFYEKQKEYGPISWNAALGKYILFVRNSDMTREVMNNSNDFNLWLTMGAKKILGEENIAFMTGQPHKLLRKNILPLFTTKALSTFIVIQQNTIRQHTKQWFNKYNTQNENDFGDYFQVSSLVREMNLDTSANVFVGNYFNEKQRKKAGELFWEMCCGFLSFPINIPGSQLNKAIKSRKELVDMYVKCLYISREEMKKGKEPDCMLDFWVEEELKKGKPFENDNEIGFHFMDFLFASQDASTSSIVWSITLLEKHKDILEKIINEIKQYKPNKEDTLTYDLLNKFVYTKKVVKEILRYRPPATMVPHIAINNTKIGNLPVQKGTVILPSIWSAHIDDFENSNIFNPERFDEETMSLSKSFLTFGYGPHRCIGMQYAVNHLMCFVIEFASNYEWNRNEEKNRDDIVFLPTIFPKDLGNIKLKKRM